jgi:hypothetical protein
MLEKTCRYCGSQERYRKEVQVGRITLPIPPKFEIQVCGNCGLVDWFVPQNALPKVREKFVRVA